jgi:hypothetical protein
VLSAAWPSAEALGRAWPSEPRAQWRGPEWASRSPPDPSVAALRTLLTRTGAQVLQRERGVANSVTERTTTVDAGMIEMAIADGWLGFVHQVVLHRREIEDFVLCFVTNARIKSSSVLVRIARSGLLAWIAMAPAAYEPRSCSRKTTVSRRLATSTGGSADCAFLDPSPVAKLARLRAAARHA